MFSKNTKIKFLIARTKRVLFLLSVWSLGFVSGLSGLYCFNSFSELRNEPVGGFHEIVIHNVSANVETPQIEETPIWNDGEFTAYTASSDETDSSPSIMASGKKVYVGAVACPSFLSLGSKIEIEGKGEFTCEDRMVLRFRDGNYFDILVNSKAEAFSFGRKKLKWRAI